MESAYKLAIEILANDKQFETAMNKDAGMGDKLADSTKAATDEVKTQVDSAKEKFSEMGENANQVMGSLGSAIGGAKGEVVSFIGEMAAAAGPIALVAGAIGLIASAWKRAQEEIDLYLERVDKTDYNSAIFNRSSKDAYKETNEAAKGGMYEGAALKADAERRLQLDVGYTAEQKKQLEAQKALGEQLIKDNRQLQISLGIGTQIFRDQVAKTAWVQKYSGLLSENEKLDEKKVSTQTEINILEAKQLELRTKIMMPGNGENKKKLEKEYEAGALAIQAKKLGLLDEEKRIKDQLFTMTGESEKMTMFDLNLEKDKTQVAIDYAADYNGIVRLMRMVNSEQSKALKTAEELLRVEKETNNASAAGYKLGTNLTGVPGVDKAGYASVKQLTKNTLIDTSGFKAEVEGANKLVDATTHAKIAIQAMNQELEGEKEIADQLTSVFQGMFSNIEGGVKAMAQSLIQSIAQIAEELAAKAAVFAIMSLLFPGSSIVAGGIGKFIGIPGMASGGIAYGPTIAQIGEYPGASTDPEVVSPLSKLKDMIGGGQMIPRSVRLQVEVGGSMSAYFEYQQKKVNNFR
jgi:hypothetical protein